MQWCRGWVRTDVFTFCNIIKQVQHPQGFRGEGEKKNRIKGERKGEGKSVEGASPTRQQLQRTHHLPSSPYCQFATMVNYGVVLLLGVLSLTDWSTIGVPMSPCYGEYQTATPPPYFTTTTYATVGYCTSKYYTT
ncbi:uncharacterized protein LOC124193057 [Daphnia pulex]|uniref:uncharacterized protein LOC124193057 n=1 Tax=Daphnia pulex TaxID=6669 RepID=UPI001EDEE6E9|nr:uncharacterized protein LOC124193057 [Daphnia pulex]